MSPVSVLIWSCVVIFIITAILTLLHISGIRLLPNADHGKVLFRALIVEIVVVAVGAFATTLLPHKDPYPIMGTLPGSMAGNKDVFINGNKNGEAEPLMPKTGAVYDWSSDVTSIPKPLDENCHQITVLDASTFPPKSRIETLCEK